MLTESSRRQPALPIRPLAIAILPIHGRRIGSGASFQFAPEPSNPAANTPTTEAARRSR